MQKALTGVSPLTAEEQILIAALRLVQWEGRLEKVVPFAQVESLGERYFGMYRLDWAGALPRLAEQGWAVVEGDTLCLTAEGERRADEFAYSHPASLYAYNEFFYRAHDSAAHSLFCQRVYGLDLCQHGMADMAQIDLLARLLQEQSAGRVLELGCGNGAVTAYLAEQTGAHCVGVEIAELGIAWAQELAAGHEDRLEFLTGDMQSLNLPNMFHAILLIDVVYFARDLTGFLKKLRGWLAPGGRLYVFYSAWGNANCKRESLQAHGTAFACAMQSAGWEYSVTDLTDAEVRHWQEKLRVAEELRPQFAAEGNPWLGERRWGEANQHQQYVEMGNVSRYLYVGL